MLAKILTHGDDRDHALRRMDRALRRLVVDGVVTNREFLVDLIAHPDFVARRHHTRWVEERFLPAWAATDTSATLTTV